MTVLQMVPKAPPVLDVTPEAMAQELTNLAARVRSGSVPAAAVSLMVWHPDAHTLISMGCSIVEHIGLLEMAKQALLEEAQS